MKQKLGVIVGRFQVAELHRGHRDLIEFVQSVSDRVLIVLGVSRTYATERNPLSYDTRVAMIRKLYTEIEFVQLADHPSDEVWSKQLDELISNECAGCEATLYGSRDSFRDVYSGGFPVEYFEPKNSCNGSGERAALTARPRISKDFLAGAIYAQTSRKPITYPTVDVAVIRDGMALLAGKSQDLGQLRFIGGFIDSTDAYYEMAAKREVMEETGGVETDGYIYLGSLKVDDWRYRSVKDGIMTSFYRASYIFGAPRPSDDVDTLEWVSLGEMMERLIPEHLPLGKMLLDSIK